MRAKTSIPLQAFKLSPDILSELGSEDVRLTFLDMDYMDMARPPYDRFDILVPAWRCIFDSKSEAAAYHERYDVPVSFNDEYIFRFKVGPSVEAGVALNSVYYQIAHKNDRGDVQQVPMLGLDWYPVGVINDPCTAKPEGLKIPVSDEAFKNFRARMHMYVQRVYILLLVVLVSKGVKKSTKAPKLSKLGIGKPSPYSAITFIGASSESDDATSSGRSVRPHFRRGHIRQQRYGASFEFVKSVFIQPVWVNMELGDASPRDHYRIGTSRFPGSAE